jgi:hypothetical protein
MTRRRVQIVAVAALALGLAAASIALASGSSARHNRHHGHHGQFKANLIGFNEVPSVNSAGHARLKLDVSKDEIDFRLDYAGLSGNPLFAHIHVGQFNVNGGVAIFFCGGGGKPACPASTSGTVTGTIVAADVVGPGAQGYAPGDLASVVKAIKAGFGYANMHTAKFPGGEIRGQIEDGNGHRGH